MMNDGMYSSDSSEWETPQAFYNKLDAEFKFTLDVCATAKTAKCKYYIDAEEDTFKVDWGNNICFMNPPYGREIYYFIEKAYQESLKKATVVCLLPARTDTSWWHEFCMKADETRFIRGRLKFSNSKNTAPFPSVIVIFRPKEQL